MARAKLGALRALVVTLGVVVNSPWISAGAADHASPPEESAKEYVVFFGLDVFARDKDTLRPVVGGSEREVLVKREGTDSLTPLRNVALQSEVSPKLSRAGVTVAGLTASPVFSPTVNPMAEMQSQMLTMQNVAAARQQEQEVRMIQAQTAAQQLTAMAANTDPRVAGYGDLLAASAVASAEAADAARTVGDMYGMPEFRSFEPGSGRAPDTADGLEVVFRISAPAPQKNLHGALRVLLRAKDQPDVVMQALKLFDLPELTAEPRKVIVRMFGLPPGYQMDSYEVHVYADGSEVATNLSSNRVELTEDEAHQYLVLRHAHANRTATIPAQVVPELFSPAAGMPLIAGRETMLVHLTIDAEGSVTGFDEELAIASEISPELKAILRDVRFLPALVAGKPAASTGSFALGELFR